MITVEFAARHPLGLRPAEPRPLAARSAAALGPLVVDIHPEALIAPPAPAASIEEALVACTIPGGASGQLILALVGPARVTRLLRDAARTWLIPDTGVVQAPHHALPACLVRAAAVAEVQGVRFEGCSSTADGEGKGKDGTALLTHVRRARN